MLGRVLRANYRGFGGLNQCVTRVLGGFDVKGGFRAFSTQKVEKEDDPKTFVTDDLDKPPITGLFRMPKTEKEREDWISGWKEHAPLVFATTGGVLAAYGISKGVYWLTSTFLHLDMQTVGTIGFAAGFGAACLTALGGVAVHRVMHIRPEVVYRSALYEIRNSKQVQETLGSSIRSGALRAYTVRGGGPGFHSTDGSFGWLMPRAQMLFQVQGSKGEGIVTVEAKRIGLSLVFTLLCLDPLDAPSTETIVLRGADRIQVRGQLRKFLLAERKRYLDTN